MLFGFIRFEYSNNSALFPAGRDYTVGVSLVANGYVLGLFPLDASVSDANCLLNPARLMVSS